MTDTFEKTLALLDGVASRLSASDAYVRGQMAERARLWEAIAGPEAWLDSWAKHVGNCQGGYVCTCGLTRARSELSAALAQVTP
jgi:hypothetical protein